ncbi:MAG: isocitrate lyase/phosphoenolpyruvate mutase family protein, partial [Alphaproteobacteria bacterium]|nr:isocitrate lyase/phosphoenolpyruvate mutase family protein [Alphaproteobacteria bacterium]
RLEEAGVAGLHIEDQADPKKCGGLPGRIVIPAAEMAAKVRAACAARRNPDTLIVARSDARAAESITAVGERLNIYLEAGADMALAAENYDLDEVKYLAGVVKGPFAICGGVPGWGGSHENAATYGAIGVNLVIYPFSSLFVAARAMRQAYAQMAREGGFSKQMATEHMVDFRDFSQFIGVDVWGWREGQFAEDKKD